MASNLKRRIQLCQIFGQLLKAGSFLHKVIFKVRLSYKDVRTVFSLSFALNGDFTKNTIFPKEQMALLHTKKKKKECWRVQGSLPVSAAMPAQHIPIFSCLFDPISPLPQFTGPLLFSL